MTFPRDILQSRFDPSSSEEIRVIALNPNDFPSRTNSRSLARARMCHPERPSKTTAPHGLTADEIQRASGAAKLLVDSGFQLFYATIGWPGLPLSRKDGDALVRDFKALLTTAQSRAALPAYWLEIIETEGGTHFNILFPASRAIVDGLRSSKKFALRTPRGKPVLDIRWASAPLKLVNDYLSKEATPQAKREFGRGIGRRRKGSHQLQGGGDRVRLSKALKADCLTAGRIEEWPRSYASRSEPPYRPAKRKATRTKEGLGPAADGSNVGQRAIHGGTPFATNEPSIEQGAAPKAISVLTPSEHQRTAQTPQTAAASTEDRRQPDLGSKV